MSCAMEHGVLVPFNTSAHHVACMHGIWSFGLCHKAACFIQNLGWHDMSGPLYTKECMQKCEVTVWQPLVQVCIVSGCLPSCFATPCCLLLCCFLCKLRVLFFSHQLDELFNIIRRHPARSKYFHSEYSNQMFTMVCEFNPRMQLFQ